MLCKFVYGINSPLSLGSENRIRRSRTYTHTHAGRVIGRGRADEEINYNDFIRFPSFALSLRRLFNTFNGKVILSWKLPHHKQRVEEHERGNSKFNQPFSPPHPPPPTPNIPNIRFITLLRWTVVAEVATTYLWMNSLPPLALSVEKDERRVK